MGRIGMMSGLGVFAAFAAALAIPAPTPDMPQQPAPSIEEIEAAVDYAQRQVA